MTLRPETKLALLAALCVTACPLAAQTAAPIDAATLAKYDKNQNGKLDDDEWAAMQAAQATIHLSPFEVRTDKDTGYQAIDAGTGGRIDLPFKLSASAMSAMTKEFMDDWSITDMRDAFRYSMSVDPGNFTQNGTPYGEFEYNFRGAGSAGNYPTRNMFLNYSVGDSYNTERFEFSMGPNSILFGDGQIGGLATSSTKLPRFERDLYSGMSRWDSWGGWRFTADLNKVVTKQFAARLNLLYQKDTYGQAWRDGTWSNDRGVDLGMTYAFTRDTLITVDAEFNNRKNLNFATTYSDQIGYYTPGYLYNRLSPNLPPSQALAGITPVSTNAQNWTYIPALPQLGLVNTGGSTMFRSTGTGFAIQPEGRSDLPGIATVARLPRREFNLAPTDSRARFKQQTYTVNLDHRFSDKMSGRASYYHYNNDRNNHGGFVNSLQYDINRTLPNGQLNPKAGMLYGEMSPNKGYQENYVHEWRGLLTYRTPLPFWRAKGQFAAVGGVRNERFEATGRSAARIDGPNQTWTAAENTLRYRYYVDEPMSYGGAGDLPPDAPGFTYRWIQTGFASVEYKDIKYAQLVAALSLWDDRVAFTLGSRFDDLVDDQYGNIPGFPNANGLQSYGGFVPGLGNRPGAHNLTKAEATTSNIGVVAWFDRGQHIGGFYNYSQNFAPPTSGAAKIAGFNADGTVNGAAFGATTGKGAEMGLKFNFLNGRVSGEARYYKNDQIDRIENNPPVGNFTAIWRNAGPVYANDNTYTQMSFRDIASIQTYGWEFKTVANLGGLRLSANYALPRTKSIDVRPGTRAYFETFQAKWAKWAADRLNDKGEALTADNATQINNQILNLQNNIAGTAPGTVNNGTNKWTGSLAATYQFGRESRLRGLSIGYGINGRGDRKVGTINPSILFNLPNNVPATPAQNRAAAFAYRYQPAYYTHDMNIAYRKRIGKYNYRFQVNVNNLTDKDDLIFNSYVTYRVLGQNSNPLQGMFPSGFNQLDPRKIMLTTAIDF